MRFSALRILKEGLTGNKGWSAHWRDPDPKDEYRLVSRNNTSRRVIGGELSR